MLTGPSLSYEITSDFSSLLKKKKSASQKVVHGNSPAVLWLERRVFIA